MQQETERLYNLKAGAPLNNEGRKHQIAQVLKTCHQNQMSEGVGDVLLQFIQTSIEVRETRNTNNNDQ